MNFSLTYSSWPSFSKCWPFSQSIFSAQFRQGFKKVIENFFKSEFENPFFKKSAYQPVNERDEAEAEVDEAESDSQSGDETHRTEKRNTRFVDSLEMNTTASGSSYRNLDMANDYVVKDANVQVTNRAKKKAPTKKKVLEVALV